MPVTARNLRFQYKKWKSKGIRAATYAERISFCVAQKGTYAPGQ